MKSIDISYELFHFTFRPLHCLQVSGSTAGSPASSSAPSTSSRQYTRQRITRVNLRDLIFYMEQERETAHSLLLYRALLKQPLLRSAPTSTTSSSFPATCLQIRSNVSALCLHMYCSVMFDVAFNKKKESERDIDRKKNKNKTGVPCLLLQLHSVQLDHSV